MIRALMFQHMVGVIGQASAALPILLVMIFVSHEAGLEVAGRFAVFTAVSAVCYAASLWGLRNLMVIDRFRTYSLASFVSFRLAATMVMALAILLIGRSGEVPWSLVFTVIFVRASDAVIDAKLGHDQALKPSKLAINSYAQMQVVKLVAVLFTLTVGYFSFESQFTFKVLCGVTLLILIINTSMLIKLIEFKESNYNFHFPIQWFGMLKGASWFAFAAFVCAILTNSPRTNLEFFFQGELLGAVGGTLALSSLFGMVFNVTWIRAFPKLADTENSEGALKAFILENLAIVLVLLLASWLFIPFFIPLILGFERSSFGALPQNVLIASAIFFFGQIFCNLFKLTARRWLEPVAYGLGYFLLIVVGFFFPTESGFTFSLFLSGIGMAFFSLMVYWAELKNVG